MKGAFQGREAFEYINTGTFAAPVWVRIVRTEDVDLPDERGGGELKTKESDDVKYLPGARTRSIAFKYARKLGSDPAYDALKTAYEDREVVDYLALNQAITVDGAVGHRGPYHVSKFSETRPFEDKVSVDIELKVADAELDGGGVWEVEPVETLTGAV